MVCSGVCALYKLGESPGKDHCLIMADTGSEVVLEFCNKSGYIVLNVKFLYHVI